MLLTIKFQHITNSFLYIRNSNFFFCNVWSKPLFFKYIHWPMLSIHMPIQSILRSCKSYKPRSIFLRKTIFICNCQKTFLITSIHIGISSDFIFLIIITPRIIQDYLSGTIHILSRHTHTIISHSKPFSIFYHTYN